MGPGNRCLVSVHGMLDHSWRCAALNQPLKVLLTPDLPNSSWREYRGGPGAIAEGQVREGFLEKEIVGFLKNSFGAYHPAPKSTNRELILTYEYLSSVWLVFRYLF